MRLILRQIESIMLKQVLFFLFWTFLSTSTLFAQDRYFAHTYTSNVLPHGNIDLELWHSSHFGHDQQFFHAQDQRLELEFGLGKGLQTSLYFNRFSTRYSEGSDGTMLKNEIGFSNEWKWKITDPSLQAVGFGLYGEWGLKGGDELELETKIILDKWIGKHLVAFNAVFESEKEFEWEENKVTKASEMEGTLLAAYQFMVKKSLGIGGELRCTNALGKGDEWENSILSGGPTVQYRGNRWFILANYLPQWRNLHKTDAFPFSMELLEHERTEFRIIVGVSL